MAKQNVFEGQERDQVLVLMFTVVLVDQLSSPPGGIDKLLFIMVTSKCKPKWIDGEITFTTKDVNCSTALVTIAIFRRERNLAQMTGRPV